MSIKPRDKGTIMITKRTVLMGFVGLCYAVFIGYVFGRMAAGNYDNFTIVGNQLDPILVVMFSSFGLIFIVDCLSVKQKK